MVYLLLVINVYKIINNIFNFLINLLKLLFLIRYYKTIIYIYTLSGFVGVFYDFCLYFNLNKFILILIKKVGFKIYYIAVKIEAIILVKYLDNMRLRKCF